MNKLDKIGIKYNTDKASTRIDRSGKTVRGHNYLETYEYFLKDYQEEEITLIELGIGPSWNCGKSLLMWSDYFPKATIVGVDIRPDVIEHEKERVKIEIGDCGNPEFLQYIGNKYKPNIIIDDASHWWSHQIIAFQYLYPTLRDNGIYIIEDLNTSFGKLRESYSKDYPVDAYEYLLALQTDLVSKNKYHPLRDKLPKDGFLNYAYEHTQYIVSLGESIILKKKQKS